MARMSDEDYAELCVDYPALKEWSPNGSTDWADLCSIFGGPMPHRMMWAIIDRPIGKAAKAPKPTLSTRAKGIADKYR